MYYMLKPIVLCICMCGIVSCKNKQETDEVVSLKQVVENSLGKKLILPNSLQEYSPFSNYVADSVAVVNSEYKIYSKVDASCGTCISRINLWNGLALEFRKYNVPVILICDSDDKFELLKYFCESGKIKKFPYPFFLDKKKEFAKLNKFMVANKGFETVLTKNDNTIVLIGNPIMSAEIKDLYMKEIE